MRADVLLVEKGLASSRTRAQELIASGRVFLVRGDRREPIKKPSQKLALDELELVRVEEDTPEARYVSRGGIKMQGALARSGLDAKGAAVLDVGISTGGFTDCVLQAGAARVVGVDVGHGQLATRLQGEPRLTLFEGVNARHLSEPALREAIVQANGGGLFDLIVIDVSFISLTLVLPEAVKYLNEDGPSSILALVKPQFEVGREGLGKNGIVKDAALYLDVETKIRRACESCGVIVEDYFESPIEGADGNREFFLLARHPQLCFGTVDPRRL